MLSKGEFNMECDGDTFLAPLQGRLVACQSIEDAVAVKTADALLRNGDNGTAAELQRLAGILVRYDCHDEAERLAHRVSRLRAAQFLNDTTGYQRPSGAV
jgi:hypothetical protein